MRANIVWMLLAVVAAQGCDCGSDGARDGGAGDGGGDGAAGSDAGPLPDGALPDGAPSDGSPPVDPCPGPAELCAGACVTTTVDPAHCGGCGSACAAGEVCFSSGCAADCPAGLTECDGSCVDMDNDSAHCGGCGSPCDMGEGCVGGSCVPAVPLGPPPARCAGGGPPIVVEGGEDPECTDDLARVSFTFGLCACNDIGVPGLSSRSLVDAYDSARGPYEPGGGGGGVGANGGVNIASTFEATGDVRTSGPTGLDIRGQTDVGQELHVDARLRLEDDLAVGGDAYVGGPFEGGGAAMIGGTLFTPDCAAVPGSIDSAACMSRPVDVPPPCACDPADIVPIAAIVAHYAMPANNDNAAVGLDPAALARPGAPARLDLPCGYYYLDRVDPGGAVTIAASGRTALFIGGDIEVSSAITFFVGPGATLDVFVGGTLHATASLRVGTPAYPRQTRFWVGGTVAGDPPWSVSLDSECDLNGLFYAPNGMFESSARLEMYGAVFAGWYHDSSETLIHYDRAAIDLGDDCPDEPGPPVGDGGVAVDAGPPEGCGSCRDCDNQACIDGRCAACTDSSQCCAPLLCIGGSCQHPPI